MWRSGLHGNFCGASALKWDRIPASGADPAGRIRGLEKGEMRAVTRLFMWRRKEVGAGTELWGMPAFIL